MSIKSKIVVKDKEGKNQGQKGLVKIEWGKQFGE
jgi:hypothetical protein